MGDSLDSLVGIVHLPEVCQAKGFIPNTMNEKEEDRMRIKEESDGESGGQGRQGEDGGGEQGGERGRRREKENEEEGDKGR